MPGIKGGRSKKILQTTRGKRSSNPNAVYAAQKRANPSIDGARILRPVEAAAASNISNVSIDSDNQSL